MQSFRIPTGSPDTLSDVLRKFCQSISSSDALHQIGHVHFIRRDLEPTVQHSPNHSTLHHVTPTVSLTITISVTFSEIAHLFFLSNKFLFYFSVQHNCTDLVYWFLLHSTLYRGADKSLARPRRKQARKDVRDARDFNNIETRAVIKFFFARQGAEGNSRRSDRNISLFPSWSG